MKIIYMESTINLLVQLKGIDYTKELVESGTLKQTEKQLNYLVIED